MAQPRSTCVRTARNGPRLWSSGPEPAESPTEKVRWQRDRRQRQRAADLLVVLMRALIQKNITPISSTSEATDVARLAWLRSCVLTAGFGEHHAAGVLILDWAARTPEFTASFIKTLGSLSKTSCVPDFLRAYRDGWLTCEFQCFWHARTKMNLGMFLQQLDFHEVAKVAAMLQRPRSRVRLRQFQSLVEAWPGLGSYCCFSLLRAVGAAIPIHFRDVTEAAESMSPNTKTISRVLPMDVACRRLRTKQAGKPDMGFLAWLFCETCKILRHEGVLAPLVEYGDGEVQALAAALASKRAYAVLRKAQHIRPVPVPSAEFDLLERIADDEWNWRHNHTEFLKVWKLGVAEVHQVACRKRPAAAVRG